MEFIDVLFYGWIGFTIGLLIGMFVVPDDECPIITETCDILMCERDDPTDCILLASGKYDDIKDDFKQCQERLGFNCMLSCYKK